MVQPHERYAVVLNNQLDHTEWVSQLNGHSYIDRFEHYGVPCTFIESTDPALIPTAQALPAGQLCSSGSRQQLIMDWFLCVDRFRVAVRPEHLDQLAAAATLQEFQAARAAIQADTAYPPPAP